MISADISTRFIPYIYLAKYTCFTYCNYYYWGTEWPSELRRRFQRVPRISTTGCSSLWTGTCLVSEAAIPRLQLPNLKFCQTWKYTCFKQPVLPHSLQTTTKQLMAIVSGLKLNKKILKYSNYQYNIIIILSYNVRLM